MRVSAEFENYKKRSARELEEFRKYANQALIKEMLSVVDNLELAIKSSKGDPSQDNGLVEGLVVAVDIATTVAVTLDNEGPRKVVKPGNE